MKTYEKPKLMFLSLDGNDQLCGSCADGKPLHKDPDLAQVMMELYKIPDRTGDGPSRDDFIGLFGNSEEQCTDKLDNYCKFTSTEQVLIAWS